LASHGGRFVAEPAQAHQRAERRPHAVASPANTSKPPPRPPAARASPHSRMARPRGLADAWVRFLISSSVLYLLPKGFDARQRAALPPVPLFPDDTYHSGSH